MFAIRLYMRTARLFSTSIKLFVFRPLLKKKWFYGFLEFFVVRNTFVINITRKFFFGLAEYFDTKIPLLLIIIPVFIRSFFLLKLFLSPDLSIMNFF